MPAPYFTGTAIEWHKKQEDTISQNRDGYTAKSVWIVGGIAEPSRSTVNDIINDTNAPKYGDEYFNTATTSRLTLASLTCVELADANPKDAPLFEFTANYEFIPSINTFVSIPDFDDEFYDYSFTNETVTTNNCIEQVAYPASGTGIAPPMDKLVGVDQDGTVDGVEVYDNSETLVVTKWKDQTLFTQAYVNQVRAELNKVNSISWYGASAGECLFRGMEKVGDNRDMVKLEFTFLISRNRVEAELPTFKDREGSNFTITGGKKGWEYLWVRPISVPETDKVVSRVDGVYVAEVYEESNYAGLELTGAV
jgi:hypothetical protein